MHRAPRTAHNDDRSGIVSELNWHPIVDNRIPSDNSCWYNSAEDDGESHFTAEPYAIHQSPNLQDQQYPGYRIPSQWTPGSEVYLTFVTSSYSNSHDKHRAEIRI